MSEDNLLLGGLRERAKLAAQEGNMTATCDARYFSQAADALEAMAGEVGRLKDRLRIANGVLAETTQKALELQTESDRLQLALSSLRSDNARMKAALELIWACSGDLFATEEARKALGGDE